MYFRKDFALAAVAAFGAVAVLAAPAAAKCTRLGFSVNDYGKDGPTRDAKDLLDKYIAKWAAEHNVTKYVTGKKDVKCDLFLNFIVFDEHTCRAEATVCYGEGEGATPQQAAKPAADGPAPATKATAKPAAAPKAAAKPQAVAPVVAEPPKAPVADSPKAAAPAAKKIETGTLPAAPAVTPDQPAAAAPAVAPAQAAGDKAAEAAAAAERAAAAAERAAAAAERAAAAARALPIAPAPPKAQ